MYIYIYVCIITESSLLRAPWSSIQRNLAADGKRCCWMTMTVYDSHLKPFSRVDSVYCITISCNFSNRPLGFLILLCQRQSWHCTDCTKQNWVPAIFDIHVHNRCDICDSGATLQVDVVQVGPKIWSLVSEKLSSSLWQMHLTSLDRLWLCTANPQKGQKGVWKQSKEA